MIQAKCVEKFRDKNNHIYGYRLKDSQGNTKDVGTDQLKNAIKNGQINILNLTLTSDNRLVDTTPNKSKSVSQQSQISEEQKIQNLILKSKALGITKEIPTACGHHCTLISKSETQHIIYIPDDVEILNGIKYTNLAFTEHIRDLQGTIKVIGGHNIQDATDMFASCQAQILDLSSFDTRKVTNMMSMFHFCKAQFIDLSSFDISNTTNIAFMFNRCDAQIKATDPRILKKYKNRDKDRNW